MSAGRVRRTATLATGALVASLLFELVLRHVYWLPYVHHPRLGSVLPAGTLARYCREGCGTSRWSADGLRRATPFDPARPSILAVGDSFTEALMTDDDAVYTHRLERLLDDGGARWQVLNVGRSGASPANYVALAPFYAERFAARWAVIQLRSPDLEGDAWDLGKTHFRRRADGGIEAVEVPPRPSRAALAFGPLRRSAALVSLGALRVRELRAAASSEPPLFRGGRPRAAAAPRETYPVEAELEALADAYGGRVTFLFLPDFDPLDVTAADDIEQRFAAACRGHGWSCVDLRADFARFAEQRESPYGFPNSSFNVGHMNDLGHAAAAALLHDEITKLVARDLL